MLGGLRARLRLPIVREAFRTFAPAFEGQRRDMAFAGLLALMTAGLQLLQYWPIGLVFDAVLAPLGGREPGITFGLPRETLLLVLCGGIVGISLLIGFFNVRQAIVAARVSKTLATRVRRSLFERLHRLALPFHQANRTGDLLVRLMGDVNMVRDLLFASWLNLTTRGFLFVGTAVMLFVVDPLLGALSLAPLPILALGVRRSSRKLTAVTHKQRTKEGNAAAMAAESLRHIRLVKAYAAEERTTREFAREARSGERANSEATRIAAGMGRLSEALTGAGLAVLIFFGAHRVLDGALTAGQLYVVTMYARMLYKPLRGLSKEGPRLSKASACAERLLEVFRIAPEETGRGEPAPVFRGAVAFDRVHAAWTDGTRALNGLTLTVEPGSLAVVQGPNGAGKSTAIAVLLRLIEPTAGTVSVDGRPIGEYELTSFRNRISYVPQEIQLFAATIRENILYGRPDAADAEVEEAAKAALAHEFVMSQPSGYETLLGEGGATLSGGEARRLMLARAALRGGSLLLLDEPLTGIDPESRPTIARAIRSIAGGRTTIVVSHGPAEEIAPDLVIDLDRGRLVSVRRPALTGTPT